MCVCIAITFNGCRWLQFCHEHFDEDCVFSKRDDALCVAYREGTVFQRMRIGVGDQKVLDSSKADRHQNIVKLKIDKKNNTCAEIVGFLVPALLPPSQVLYSVTVNFGFTLCCVHVQVEYHGTDVKILCRRAPVSVFGTERPPLELPLSSLDINKKYKVSNDDLLDLEKKAVQSINVLMKSQGKRVDVLEVAEINSGSNS